MKHFLEKKKKTEHILSRLLKVCMMNPKTSWKKADSAFFPALLTDILRFYEEKTVSFDVAETLEVMKIREGVLKARETPNTWIEL